MSPSRPLAPWGAVLPCRQCGWDGDSLPVRIFFKERRYWLGATGYARRDDRGGSGRRYRDGREHDARTWNAERSPGASSEMRGGRASCTSERATGFTFEGTPSCWRAADQNSAVFQTERKTGYESNLRFSR